MTTATVTEKGYYDTQGDRFVLLNVGDKLEVLDPQPEPPNFRTKYITGNVFKGIWAKTDTNVVAFLEDGNFTLTITGKVMQLN